MTLYFEQRYCDDCMRVHWLEVTRVGLEICHGEDYAPHSDKTHYTRRLGHGIEVIDTEPQPLPLAWQMAADLHNER
jgi:hypothetical protein